MSDGDLKQSADSLHTRMLRDIAFFVERNITEVQLAAFNNLISLFDETDTDQEHQGLVTEATEIKNKIAENIRKAIRPIRNMAEIEYGTKGRYCTFKFTNMNDMPDADLYRLARRVARVGNKLFDELAQHGLTVAQLTALAQFAKQFDGAIENMEDAAENRDMATQNRINKGNALWAEMSRLASIGRSLFEDENEAKYNDYLLIAARRKGKK
jgi:hypothetical protein